MLSLVHESQHFWLSKMEAMHKTLRHLLVQKWLGYPCGSIGPMSFEDYDDTGLRRQITRAVLDCIP